MFQFPSPPDTLVARQVECVCCREIFTVSEDIVTLEPGVSEFWQMTPDQYADIRQRYDPRISRKPIIPEFRAEPQGRPHPIQHFRRSQRAYINCPRCGADNRNWVQITSPPVYSPAFGLDRLWARFPMAVWGLIAALLVVIAGMVLASQTNQTRSQTVLLLVFALIGAIVPFFVLTGMWRNQRMFRLQREFSHSRSLPPLLSTGLAIFLILAVLIPAFIYFVMPAVTNFLKSEPALEDRIDTVLVSLAPTMFNATSQDQILLNNATVTLQAILDENRFDCQSSTFTTMITTLEAMLSSNNYSAYDLLLLQAINNLRALRDSGPECRPEMLQSAIASLQVLLNTCGTGGVPPVVVTPTPPTTLPSTGKAATNKRLAAKTASETRAQTAYWPCNSALLTNMILQLNAMQQPPPVRSPYEQAKYALEGSRWLALTSTNQTELNLISDQVGIFEEVMAGESTGNGRASNLTAARLWLIIVGTATIVASIFASSAVNGFIGQINRHLPRPIGYSIANMTKVVIQDLRRALDIPDEALRQIEWTEVDRRDNGGIMLKGIFLPPEDPSANNSTYVRTQCCTVWSDAWARIIEAEIHYCRIPKISVYRGYPGSSGGQREVNEPESEEPDVVQEFFRPARPKEDAVF
ncbi:MAG: hypothetical protein KC441_09765 [Anaerolineales bacterium]|nr:hypothetical protein [Anaerolineales bacterium]